MNIQLLPVKDRKILEAHGIYFAPTTLRRWHCQTLRRWHCQGINPQIFTKIGGLLFINKDKWDQLVAKKTQAALKRAKKIQQLR